MNRFSDITTTPGWQCRLRAALSRLSAGLLVATLLTGCITGDDDEEPTATATATQPPAPSTPAATPTVATPEPVASPARTPVSPATIAASSAQVVSDGICRATVPANWVEESPGRGTTLEGHAFSVFGNRFQGNSGWDQAVELFKNQAATRSDATVTEGDGFVHVVYADDLGFAHRQRFDDRYCDIRITARGGPIAGSEQAYWDAIVGSLAPAG